MVMKLSIRVCSRIFRSYNEMHIYAKIFIAMSAVFYAFLLGLVVIMTPSRISQFLYDRAHELSLHPFGWLALFAAIVCVSFPPAVGHTTLLTLCGFAYGMKGFFIASSASLFGSCLAFMTLRLFFGKRIHAWSAKNEKWQALEAVVRAKGLPLIILIRISPFPPWVFANALFASIEATALWQFAIATIFVFPKLLLYVFIGSRVAALSDEHQRIHMDTPTRVVNSLLIAGGFIVAISAGWIVYHLVQKQIRKLESDSSETDSVSVNAGDIEEAGPLLRDWS